MVEEIDAPRQRPEAVIAQAGSARKEAQAHVAAAPRPWQSRLAFLHPRNWHPAVALALVAALIGQAAMIGRLEDRNARNGSLIAAMEKRVGDLEFQLASGPEGEAGRRPAILIQVHDKVSWQALSDLLGSEGLTIVDGPSDNTLSLASPLEGAALDAVIARLRASPLVASADKAA